MKNSIVSLLPAIIVAGAIATFTTLPAGPAFAQTSPATTTDKPKAESSTASQDAKKSADDERKAKRAEARKAKADKRATASAGRRAARDRQKQCGAEWKEARRAGKVDSNMTWPQYWSACNTRLKAKAT